MREVNVALLVQTDQHECLFLHVWFHFFLCAVYCTLDAADSLMHSLLDGSLLYQNQNLILTGDILPLIGINRLIASVPQVIILDLMFPLNFKQTIHDHTRQSPVLDLFLVNQTFF